MGGVIVSSPFAQFAAYEAANGLPDGFLRSVNATDPDTNAWAQLERSEIDLDAFGPLFAAESKAQGHEVDGRLVIQMLTGEVHAPMVDAVRRCGVHLKTGLLTNNFLGGSKAARRESAMGELFTLFDVVIESSQVGVRKPDPRFYELACEQLAIRPDEAVFLDDLGVNLKPARALGMTTIKVVDPDDAIDELEAVVGFALR